MRFKKGMTPWNKGKTMSTESRQKLSNSCKGRIPWNKDKTYKCPNISIANTGRKASEETKQLMSSKHSGDKNGNWKGGHYKEGNYIIVRKNGSRRREHRVVAERALRRKLKSSEIVHHINMDGTDNRNCNLLICDRKYHYWLHMQYEIAFAKTLCKETE